MWHKNSCGQCWESLWRLHLCLAGVSLAGLLAGSLAGAGAFLAAQWSGSYLGRLFEIKHKIKKPDKKYKKRYLDGLRDSLLGEENLLFRGGGQLKCQPSLISCEQLNFLNMHVKICSHLAVFSLNAQPAPHFLIAFCLRVSEHIMDINEMPLESPVRYDQYCHIHPTL